MDENRILMHKPVHLKDIVEDYSTFTFRQDRPHHWLQRMALSVLRKLKCYAREEANHRVEYVEFRADTFSATLYDVHREVFRYFDPRRKMRVVMGPEEFRQLEREWHEYAAFTVPVHYQHRNGPLEIHGMTVQVVPWVKGLFVVPDQP